MISFHSRVQSSNKSIFVFVNEFLSLCFKLDFFQLFQRINLKKAEVSRWQIFFKIGVLKNLKSWRLKASNFIKKDTTQAFSGKCCEIFKGFLLKHSLLIAVKLMAQKVTEMQNKFLSFLCFQIKKLLLSFLFF